MKILLVVTGLGVGGAERVVTSLADSFAGRGHEVVIAYLTGRALLRPRCRQIRVVDLQVDSAYTLARAYLRLRHLIKAFEPDIVHSHMVHANLLARLLRLSVGIPRVISSAHSTHEGGHLRMALYRLTDRLADISTNVSDAAVEAFVARRAVPPGRMITVHNGISTDEFRYSEFYRQELREELGLAPDCPLILAVGRLYEAKDYPTLLAALGRLGPDAPDFRVLIVGDGPLRARLVAQAEALGLAGRLRFLGVRSDVARLMTAADIFVLSSAWEGFGLVVAEAMACQRVVVATDSGGVKEVLGDAGGLVPARDPEALARGLRWALSLSERERAMLGERARRRVQERFSLDAAAARWLALYAGPTGLA